LVFELIIIKFHWKAPLSSSYNATKHALHVSAKHFNFQPELPWEFYGWQGYFETARSELAPKGISITMICPGMVHSDILTACATENPGEVCIPKNIKDYLIILVH
jgi:NAD(P)-dependent dehydrogenase (short-subunit alcohol dehydrogenase family)